MSGSGSTGSSRGDRKTDGGGAPGSSRDISPRQERVLSEISHELGNYFHKLYYWAELLREQRPAAADAEPAALLERTVRELEAFLKAALEFFRPISVVPMAMPVDDVVRSVRAVVTRHAEPAPLTWTVRTLPPGMVAIDPGRFSFVLEGLVRAVRGATETPISAALDADGVDGRAVVLTLTAKGPDRPAADTVGAAIEWAIVERIVDAHSGSLVKDVGGAGCSVRLQLPIAP